LTPDLATLYSGGMSYQEIFPGIAAHAEFVEGTTRRNTGYRPTVLWNGHIIWQSPNLVPPHRGDYDSSQWHKALSLAEQHIVERLTEVFA
jgi:hypothetical protein